MIKLFYYMTSIILILWPIILYQRRWEEKMVLLFKRFFPFAEFKNGEMVREYLTDRLAQSSPKMISTQYKFYDQLANEISGHAQRFGIPQTGFIKSLRSGLISDLKFERKITQELKAGFTQCLFIMIITWLFIFFSCSILHSQISFKIAGLIVFLQLSGFVIFSWFFHSLKQKIFKEYGAILSVLFRLKGLLLVGRPLGQALSESGHAQLKLKSSKFLPLLNQLESALIKLQTKGVGIQEDLDHLIDEIWFLSELDFEQFIKQLFALKLLIILLFYFSSYFLYLISLLSTFVLN